MQVAKRPKRMCIAKKCRKIAMKLKRIYSKEERRIKVDYTPLNHPLTNQMMLKILSRVQGRARMENYKHQLNKGKGSDELP